MFYSSKVEGSYQFEYFNDRSSRNLSFIRQLIESAKQIPRTNPTLRDAFQKLIDSYPADNNYPQVSLIPRAYRMVVLGGQHCFCFLHPKTDGDQSIWFGTSIKKHWP